MSAEQPSPDQGQAVARAPHDRALRIFLLIAFGVPWCGWTLLALSGIDAREPSGQVLFYSGGACSVAGLIAAFVAGGRPRLQALLRACVSVRVPGVWWAVAVLLPVVVDLCAITAYGWSHDGLGDLAPGGVFALLAPASLMAFLSGPLGEEIGWRGFLLPTCLKRTTPLRASLVVGLTWTLWHLPLYYDGLFADWRMLSLFTIDIVCSSIILTAISLGTGGSVLLAMVFHWTSNVGQGVAGAMFPSVAIADELVYFGIRESILVVATLCVLSRAKASFWRTPVVEGATHAS